MKLTATSQFDKKLIEGTQPFKDLESFIDYQIQFNQNVERILRQNVSIADNINCRTVTLTFAPNVPNSFSENRQVLGVIPIKSTRPITSFYWEITTSGSVNVTVNIPSQAEITLLVFY